MESRIQEIVRQLGWERASKAERVCNALVGIGIDPKNCFFDQKDNLIIPVSEIQKPKIADRKFIKDVIELHEMGKDVEQIMFSLDLPYEEPENE